VVWVQGSDSTLLSGEIGGKLLDCFSTELAVVYEPAFREQPDWGKAPPEQPSEFKGDLGKFVASIEEAVRSMGAGVTLSRPRKDIDLDAVLRSATAGAVPAGDTLHALEGVVDDWCNVINRCVYALYTCRVCVCVCVCVCATHFRLDGDLVSLGTVRVPCLPGAGT
jgi:hypothetical protein